MGFFFIVADAAGGCAVVEAAGGFGATEAASGFPPVEAAGGLGDVGATAGLSTRASRCRTEHSLELLLLLDRSSTL